jgi:lipoate-protein ligase A
MAVDACLLQNAGSGPAGDEDACPEPVFRLYTWAPHCISIGYHQTLDSIDLDRCKDAGIDVVRRPTGGRAVFHAEEVTYSVIIPRKSELFAGSTQEVYGLISRGLARGLKLLGVDARLEKRSVDLRSHYETMPSVSCFSAAARYEIVIDKKKLVGSAQKRDPAGILQHGSILTGPAHLDLPRYLTGMDEKTRAQLRAIMEKKTITLKDCLDHDPTWEEVTKVLRRGLAEELSVEFIDSELTDTEEKGAASRVNEFGILSVGRGVTEEDA